MKEELVSIIIPVFNAEKYIEEAIQTVEQQTYSNWEMILIDDDSTDKSKNIIEKKLSNKMTLIELKRHSGTAIARNEGIKVAKGRYISFLDADDLWKKEKIEKQLKFMKRYNYAFTCTAYQFIRNGKKGKEVKIQEKWNYKSALKNTRILSSTVMIDTKNISKEECYMVNVINEDVATWWKILKKGYIAYGLKEVLVYYRRYKQSKSAYKIINAKNRWKLYREEEKLSFIQTIYYFLYYIWYGLITRI